MTRSRSILTGSAAVLAAFGIPIGLVLATTSPASACTTIATTGATPLCGSPGGGATYSVTASPSTVAPGDPVTLTMTATNDATGDRFDFTPGAVFSMVSGSCAGRVCTPGAVGALTVTGVHTDPMGTATATTTVTVKTPDHLAIRPGYTTAVAGQRIAYSVYRAAADGTLLDDDRARATVTLGGAPCPGAVCTATIAGPQIVTATDGALTGGGALQVQAGPAASIVVTPHLADQWNNLYAGSFPAEAYDAYGNDRGDVTEGSSYAITPDGRCTNYSCTADTSGSHTVTATYGSLTGAVTLDATKPVPAAVGNLPGGQVGAPYSHSVLSVPDATATIWVDPSTTLPPGLTLSLDGILSGIPTAAGTYSFGVEAKNDAGASGRTTTITIAAAAPPVRPTISLGSVSTLEGNSGRAAVAVPVRLTAAAGAPVTVSWHTVNGTAVAGKDYVAAHGTLTIPAGQLAGQVTVMVIGDKVREPNETFSIVLSAPHGATLGTARGVVTVRNND